MPAHAPGVDASSTDVLVSRLRVIIVFAAFSLGMIVARERALEAPAGVLVASALVGALAVLLPRLPSAAALALALVLAGAGWWSVRLGVSDERRLLSHLPSDREIICTVEGVVIDPPEEHSFGRGAFASFHWRPPVQRFKIDVRQVELDSGDFMNVRGRLTVDLAKGETGLKPGERIRLKGLARGYGPPRNAGEHDGRLRARQDGLAGWMRLPGPELIERLPASGLLDRLRQRVAALIHAARERSSGLFASASSNRGAALMDALILGERSQSLRPAQDAFARVGLAHMLSISGLHVAIMAAAVLVLLRAFRDWGRLEAPLLIVIVTLYLLLVPSRTPVMRAGVMVIGFALAEMGGRRYDSVQALTWIALGVLIWRPMDLWDPGFQLSFGLVLALIVFTAPLSQRWFGDRPDADHLSMRARIGWWMRDLLCASVVAWSLAAPAVIYHFGVFSPLAPIVTVLLMPFFVVTLCAGYVQLVLGLAAPAIAEILNPLVSSLAGWLSGAVLAIDTLPIAAVRIPIVGLPWTVAATGAIAWWLHRGSWRRVRGVGVSALIALWLALHTSQARVTDETALRIDTIDVGEGTCHLIRAGGDSMLWDCGSRSLGIGEFLVPRAVRALGAGRVERIVISHPNIDHFAGVLDVIEPLGVRELVIGEAFLMSEQEDPDSAAAFLLQEARRTGVGVRVVARGDALDLAGAPLHFIAPDRGARPKKDNDASLVMRIDVETDKGARTALFCGDIEKAGIRSLTSLVPEMRADILEIPHHGSAIPEAMRFVEAVDPLVAIQSTGAMRRGDERWDEVRRHRVWLSTTDAGAAWVEVMADGEIRAGSMLGGASSVDRAQSRQP